MTHPLNPVEADRGLPSLGAVLDGRYQVLEFVSRGGFAVVYRARHLLLDRPVALKVYAPRAQFLESETTRQQFLREARIAAALRHPNLAHIYDVGIFGLVGRPYIVMELLEGHTLDVELARAGAMPLSRALDLVLGCLEGLATGHAQGIVHRDLKPSNLFLRRAGTKGERETLIVLDFGVASAAGAQPATTEDGQVLGTPRYLAPEIIAARPSTPATDVYQAALILVEMVTGRPVVDVQDPELCIEAHRRGGFELPAELDRPLADVVRRALVADPRGRYADAGAFRRALLRVHPPDRRRSDRWPARVDPATAAGSEWEPPGAAPASPTWAEAADSADDFDTLFTRAWRAYLGKDYRQALELFQACVDRRPDHQLAKHNVRVLRRRVLGE
jgi:serine/threonine-protein kinase